VVFVRDIPTDLDRATLGKAIDLIPNWKDWHHMAHEVQALDGRGIAFPLRDQTVMTGEVIEMTIWPKQQSWKEFKLTTEVTRYERNQKLGVRLLKDSTGRILPKLFDELTWTIELQPRGDGESGTLIHGVVTGHTHSWRSRLFSRIATRIMMNQVFYANLQALAELKEPKSLIPPQTQQ
jgi:hypothetical protein